MSSVEDIPISVWLLKDGKESIDHYHDLHYSKDRCTVTCWVADELIQNAKSICWKSSGSGQPSKIRVFTERAHALYHNDSCSEITCKECEATASKNDGRILTIKVEVVMPSEKRPPLDASGSLPIKKDGKKKPQSEGEITSPSFVGTRRRYTPHPYHPGLQPKLLPLFPSFEIPPPPVLSFNHTSPPKLITFYFRARPRESLRSHYGECSQSLLPKNQIHYPRMPIKPLASSSKNRSSSENECDSSDCEDFSEIESTSPKSPIVILPYYGTSGSRLPMSETRSTVNQSRKPGDPKFKPYHVKPAINRVRRIRRTPIEEHPADLPRLDGSLLGSTDPRDFNGRRRLESSNELSGSQVISEQQRNEVQKKCLEWSSSLQV